MTRHSMVAFGKERKRDAYADLQSDYLKRLSRYSAKSVVTWYDDKPVKVAERLRLFSQENSAKSDLMTVLLDPGGKSWSTAELKREIETNTLKGVNHFRWLIGPAPGFTESQKSMFGVHWSLSKLTLPHRMALLLLNEQLYRAHSIMAGSPYDK